MKYAALSCLLLLGGCASKEPRIFICFNPLNALQSFEFHTDDARVKLTPYSIVAEVSEKSKIVVPLNLCIEVKSAETR